MMDYCVVDKSIQFELCIYGVTLTNTYASVPQAKVRWVPAPGPLSAGTVSLGMSCTFLWSS